MKQRTTGRPRLSRLRLPAALGALALAPAFVMGCMNMPAPSNACDEAALETGDVVRFSTHIQCIFDTHCTSCHFAGSTSQQFLGIELPLTAGSAYGAIVNVTSNEDATWKLVVPGDPEASLLYRKIRDSNPPTGARMPLFAPPLSEQEIEWVRRWIEDGAPNN